MTESLEVCGGCVKEEGQERNLRLGGLDSAKANMPSPSHVPLHSEDYAPDFVEGYWNDDYD